MRQQRHFAGAGRALEDDEVAAGLHALPVKIAGTAAILLHEFDFLLPPGENWRLPPFPRTRELFCQRQIGAGWFFLESEHIKALPAVPILLPFRNRRNSKRSAGNPHRARWDGDAAARRRGAGLQLKRAGISIRTAPSAA